MSQGLFTTLSGLTTSQTMMDVIADNIANLNTTGFKSSNISFETVFSNTISSGGVPSETSGGVNPKQVGLGATLSDISKNFARGSVQSTGRTNDLNIQGDGFFTLLGSDNSVYLSRAGNFSVDAQGNMVNPQGLKVVGTSQTSGLSGSTTTVQIPTSLVIQESNTVSNGMTDVTTGDFTVAVNGAAAQTISVADTDTVQDIVDKINANLTNSTAGINSSGQIVIQGSDTVVFANTTSNFASFIGTPYTSAVLSGTPATGTFDISVNGGAARTVTIAAGDTYTNVVSKINDALGTTPASLSKAVLNSSNQIVIGGSDTLAFSAGTSTFPTTASFTHTGSYTSTTLIDTPKVSIAAGDSTDSNNCTISSYSIGNDGSISATYSNGGKLTVTGDITRSLKYITAASNQITGTNLTNTGSVVDPAQLQIQMAHVINPAGMEAKGGNLFSLNEGAGTPSFGIGGKAGFGTVESGGLEASNVDLSSEFAKMVFAQRGVEANSRAFSVQEQIMQLLVNLGRG